jgi:hypothetical protein
MGEGRSAFHPPLLLTHAPSFLFLFLRSRIKHGEDRKKRVAIYVFFRRLTLKRLYQPEDMGRNASDEMQ